MRSAATFGKPVVWLTKQNPAVIDEGDMAYWANHPRREPMLKDRGPTAFELGAPYWPDCTERAIVRLFPRRAALLACSVTLALQCGIPLSRKMLWRHPAGKERYAVILIHDEGQKTCQCRPLDRRRPIYFGDSASFMARCGANVARLSFKRPTVIRHLEAPVAPVRVGERTVDRSAVTTSPQPRPLPLRRHLGHDRCHYGAFN
jgi:hypothetical protein